jgi:ubiquinone/menaquinone biosynthesis C-methylase UbiE
MSLWQTIASQFGNPRGIPGEIAGYIMAHRRSNIERSDWAVSLLDLNPTDRVLEIGFGPGVTIQAMSRIVSEGLILGIDHSAVMVRQASRRNRESISSGRVRLLHGSISDLLPGEGPFDKILDINSFQFWKDPVDALVKMKTHLRPGGMIAIVHQPRKPGAGNDDTVRAGKKYAELLREAGYQNITIEQKKMKPVPVTCARGKAP